MALDNANEFVQTLRSNAYRCVYDKSLLNTLVLAFHCTRKSVQMWVVKTSAVLTCGRSRREIAYLHSVMLFGETLPFKFPAPTTKTLGVKNKTRSVSAETHERRNDPPVVQQTTDLRASSSPESRTSPATRLSWLSPETAASQRQTALTLLALGPCAICGNLCTAHVLDTNAL